MTANTMTFAFRTGGNAAADAEKAAADAAKARRNTGPDYFSLKEDGEQTVIRPVTDHDDWIWVGQHSFVPTKPGPKNAEKWPPSMTSVCRHDAAFSGHYSDCYICDNKLKNSFGKVSFPQIRVWALAIERELVRGDGSELLGGPSKKGVVIGVRDKIDEVEETGTDGKPTGNVLTYPKILVLNQPMKSFFGSLKALHGLYGTVCDRDFVITREGKGTDTTYRINALDPIADLKPGTPAWDKYLQAITERGINLGAIVADKAADAYYARFWDPTKEVDKDGNVTDAGAGASAGGGLSNLPSAGPQASGYTPDMLERVRQMGLPSNG